MKCDICGNDRKPSLIHYIIRTNPRKNICNICRLCLKKRKAKEAAAA